MNATDQPDETPDEPTVAHYQRADAAKMPTHPAGQQAAIEGMLARARLNPTRSPAPNSLAAQMMELIEEHERETVAGRALAGDPNPTDADPLEYVRTIADNYARHRDLPDADAMYLELANELTLDDIRALRLAGEAAVAATPRAIKAARDDGMKPPAIADEVGLTVSRVYQVLRDLDGK